LNFEMQQRAAANKDFGDDITGDGGIFKKVITPGNGEKIPENVVAIVHYTGTLLDGSVFDR
jgi:FKBP-type peptidyl-prolyl cis-trans isomerase